MMDLYKERGVFPAVLDIRQNGLGTAQDQGVRSRPGRKLGAEKRRLAREQLRDFYGSEVFGQLPTRVRLALFTLCPPVGSKLPGEST